jgi:hypothetical protein
MIVNLHTGILVSTSSGLQDIEYYHLDFKKRNWLVAIANDVVNNPLLPFDTAVRDMIST